MPSDSDLWVGVASTTIAGIVGLAQVLVSRWAAVFAVNRTLAHERTVQEEERARFAIEREEERKARRAEGIDRQRDRLRHAYCDFHATLAEADGIYQNNWPQGPSPELNDLWTALEAKARSQFLLLRFLERDEGLLQLAAEALKGFKVIFGSAVRRARNPLRGPAEDLLAQRLTQWRKEDGSSDQHQGGDM